MEYLEKQRDVSIDVAKGLGILAVILGHCGASVVSIFHMPFFFIMSGVFMSKRGEMSEFIKRRARRVLVPYLFGVCLTIICAVIKDIISGDIGAVGSDILKWFLAGLYGKGAKGNFLVPGIVKIGALWFLLATFYGTVIVRRFLENKSLIVIAAVIAYVGFATKEIVFLPFSLQNGMVASFFIAIGVYCKQYEIFNRKPDLFVIGGCIGLCIFAIVNHITLSMVNLNFPYGLLNIAVALAVSYLVVKLAQVITEKYPLLKRLLAYCGTNSLIILVYHAVEINILRWGWINTALNRFGIENTTVFVLSQFAVRAILCLLCTAGTNHIKPLKKIFT